MQFTIFHFYKLNFLKKNYYVEHVTKFIPCVGEKKALKEEKYMSVIVDGVKEKFSGY